MSKLQLENIYNTPDTSFIGDKPIKLIEEPVSDCSVADELNIGSDLVHHCAQIKTSQPNTTSLPEVKSMFPGFSFFKYNFKNAYKLLVRRMDITKAIDTKVKNDTFYAPCNLITQPISILIKHINLDYSRGVENSIYTFEISCDYTWYVTKTLSEIESITKKQYKYTTSSYLKRNNEISSIFQIKSGKLTNAQIQLFMLTGVVDKFSLKSNYIFIKEKKRLCPTKVKIVGRVLALYKSEKLRHVFNLHESEVFPIHESKDGLHSFILHTENKEYVLSCLTEDERNEWVRYLRKNSFNVQ